MLSTPSANHENTPHRRSLLGWLLPLLVLSLLLGTASFFLLPFALQEILARTLASRGWHKGEVLYVLPWEIRLANIAIHHPQLNLKAGSLRLHWGLQDLLEDTHGVWELDDWEMRITQGTSQKLIENLNNLAIYSPTEPPPGKVHTPLKLAGFLPFISNKTSSQTTIYPFRPRRFSLGSGHLVLPDKENDQVIPLRTNFAVNASGWQADLHTSDAPNDQPEANLSLLETPHRLEINANAKASGQWTHAQSSAGQWLADRGLQILGDWRMEGFALKEPPGNLRWSLLGDARKILLHRYPDLQLAIQTTAIGLRGSNKEILSFTSESEILRADWRGFQTGPFWLGATLRPQGQFSLAIDSLQAGPVLLKSLRAAGQQQTDQSLLLEAFSVNLLGGRVRLAPSHGTRSHFPLQIFFENIDAGLLLDLHPRFLGSVEGTISGSAQATWETDTLTFHQFHIGPGTDATAKLRLPQKQMASLSYSYADLLSPNSPSQTLLLHTFSLQLNLSRQTLQSVPLTMQISPESTGLTPETVQIDMKDEFLSILKNLVGQRFFLAFREIP